MVYSQLLLSAFALQAAAFPFAAEQVKKSIAEKRQTLPPAGSDAAKALSASRGNCGLVPCLVFNPEEQYVDITEGSGHEWVAPGPNDIRGPCPGLNAAANHRFLDHGGVQTILGTITGLGEAYGMSVDLAGFLAAYAVVFNGDPVTGTWSIGGPPPKSSLAPILGVPQGISFSHNNYEGDVSITRNDAYLNNGDAYSLNLDRFTSAYLATASPDRYTMDSWAQNFDQKMTESISTNPYFFSAPFAGLVAPAAYNFVLAMMSNHTAEEPEGYLDGAQFKTFFSVSGEPGSFVWTPGHERIPDNWYRRTSLVQYNAVSVFEDLIPEFLAYPNTFRIGGNLGKVNTYEGFDFSDLTGGVFDNADMLLQGDNLRCFFAQAAAAIVPDVLSAPLLTPVTSIVAQFFAPMTNGASCPAELQVNTDLSGKFPGAAYKPEP